ncbi:MAG: hypothetical protein A370_04754 [Clostridium sp. Maddingley MBC34-26]|nr:MAG: hypothetical protein A370_04754 [Clostridium sp. Maddingley MBC34-26]
MCVPKSIDEYIFLDMVWNVGISIRELNLS